MDECYFELAGLGVALYTQEAFRVAARLQPFLSQRITSADCTIRVQTRQNLPEITENAVWNGPECYDRQGESLRIFHCDTPKAPAFAVTQLETDGNVRIFVLPGYEARFSGTAGILNRISLENLLLRHQGLLLHAAFIKYDGKGILFTGPSGIGKTTQADLWKKHLGAEIINGDRAILRKEGSWTAYGSPYAGSSGIYRNEKAPVCAIVALKQGKENILETLSGREAFGAVYPQLALCRWDKPFMEKATDLCLALLENVPVYRLSCLPSESAVQCLQKGLGL